MASLISRGVALLTSLISIPLTYRYLGAERYGIWMVLTSLIAAMGFADLGIGNGVVNAISEAYGRDDRELARRHVTSALTLLLFIAVIVGIAGLSAYPFIPWVRVFNVKSNAAASEGARAFLVLFLWFDVNIPLGVITRVQAGLQKAYWSQVVAACGSLLSLVTLVAVIIIHGSLPLLVLASTFGTIAGVFSNGWILFREHPWLIPHLSAFRVGSAQKILKLGLMFFVLQVAISIGFASDNIVITQVLGAAAVAVYAVPQKLFAVVSMLVTMGLSPMWPAYGEAMARGDVEWVRRVFRGSLRLVTLAVAPTCATLVFMGPWIVRVAMGKSLPIPFSVFVVLGIWGVVSAISNVVAVLLNGTGVLRGQTIIAIIAGLSNLALSVFLTRRFGVIGVCLGSIIAQLVIALPSCAFLVHALFLRLSNAKLTQTTGAALLSPK